MIKFQKICLVLMAVLLLPGLAQATHLTEITVNGDCEGWTATVDVHFRSTVFEADLDFDIILLDAAGEELERFTHASVITREPEAGPDAVYMFDGAWEGYFESAFFMVVGEFHISAPWGWGGVNLDEESKETEMRLECTVPTDDVSWDRVKSLYR